MPVYTGSVRRIANTDDYLVVLEVGDGNLDTTQDIQPPVTAANLGAALTTLGTAISGLGGIVATIRITVVTR